MHLVSSDLSVETFQKCNSETLRIFQRINLLELDLRSLSCPVVSLTITIVEVLVSLLTQLARLVLWHCILDVRLSEQVNRRFRLLAAQTCYLVTRL
jgi:hypothetical protein